MPNIKINCKEDVNQYEVRYDVPEYSLFYFFFFFSRKKLVRTKILGNYLAIWEQYTHEYEINLCAFEDTRKFSLIERRFRNFPQTISLAHLYICFSLMITKINLSTGKL